MLKTCYCSVLIVCLLLGNVGIALPSGTYSTSVSCSIPVVPGLNAPLTDANSAEAAAEAAAEGQATNEGQQPNTIIEEQEIYLAQASGVRVTVKTIYTR